VRGQGFGSLIVDGDHSWPWFKIARNIRVCSLFYQPFSDTIPDRIGETDWI
jgi:hypothetical protein